MSNSALYRIIFRSKKKRRKQLPEIQSNLEPEGAIWEGKVTHIYSSYWGFTDLLKSTLIVMTEGIKLVKYLCASAKIYLNWGPCSHKPVSVTFLLIRLARRPLQSLQCYFQPQFCGVWCCNDFVGGKFAACSSNVALLIQPFPTHSTRTRWMTETYTTVRAHTWCSAADIAETCDLHDCGARAEQRWLLSYIHTFLWLSNCPFTSQSVVSQFERWCRMSVFDYNVQCLIIFDPFFQYFRFVIIFHPHEKQKLKEAELKRSL